MSRVWIVIVLIVLVGGLVLAGLLQLVAWPVILFIVKSALLLSLLGAIIGVVAENSIGREKGFLSSFLGVILILIIAAGFIATYVYLYNTQPPMSGWGDSILWALSLVLMKGSATLGRQAVRRMQSARVKEQSQETVQK